MTFGFLTENRTNLFYKLQKEAGEIGLNGPLVVSLVGVESRQELTHAIVLLLVLGLQLKRRLVTLEHVLSVSNVVIEHMLR